MQRCRGARRSPRCSWTRTWARGRNAAVPGRAQVAALFLDAHLGAGADAPEETPAAERLLAHARATARWVAPFSAALGATRARRRGVPPRAS